MSEITIKCCSDMNKALKESHITIDVFGKRAFLVGEKAHLVCDGEIKFCPYCGKKIKVVG